MRLRTVCGTIALAALFAVSRAAADDLPQYPQDQQAMLNDVEDQVVQLQRKLHSARQRNDQSEIDTLNQQLKTLQDKRRTLIDLTKDRLTSP